MFFGQDTTIYFDSDTHTSLDINCNGFLDYSSYGIYSNGATLKSQGSTTSGAGNNFMSGSSYTNHQINHSANAITYNTDPSFSFTLASGGATGYSVTTSLASADAACYSVSARMAHFPEEKTEEYKSESILLSCFPNPSDGKITFVYQLQSNAKNAFITINDVFGRRVKIIKLEFNSMYAEENLGSLPEGIYFYTLNVDGRDISTKKVIIGR